VTGKEMSRLVCASATLAVSTLFVVATAFLIAASTSTIDSSVMEGAMLPLSVPWFVYWAIWCNLTHRTTIEPRTGVFVDTVSGLPVGFFRLSFVGGGMILVILGPSVAFIAVAVTVYSLWYR
jgi:hypothetical protein